MNMVWKNGFSPFTKADANKVADEIEAIGESATPEQILEKAKDESTELHKCFVWDDTEAAKRWRLHTARLIVCNIVIERVDRREDVPQIRYFEKAIGPGYKPKPVIIQKPDEYQAMLQRALAELHAFKLRYKGMNLTELEEIFALIP